jgi:hypothetical protein
MADNNLYKFVGISRNNGQPAVRYASQANRAGVLRRAGHTEVRFIELEFAGRVEDCVDALLREEWVQVNPQWHGAALKEAERLGFVVA